MKTGLIQQGLDWYQADELVRPMRQLPDEDAAQDV